MSLGEAAVLVVAGFGAGLTNGVAGGGTMVSFPVLIALGYPAVTANVTSAVGIWPGYLGSTMGFRRVIDGQAPLLRSLALASVAGSVVGVALLLGLPSDAFRSVVPYLLFLASGLFAVQPLIVRRLRTAPGTTRGHVVARQVGVFITSIYGGYFGAGFGVITLVVLGLTLSASLVVASGIRSVLTLMVNTVAVAAFLVVAPVSWGAAALLASTSLIGGYVGAHVARRIPTWVLRTVVIVFGLVAAVGLLLR